MKKVYVYDVAGFEFTDDAAFGKAWKEAKALATELHCAIYRTVKTENSEEREVYFTAGLFNSVRFADEYSVKIF